jgi:hypothetical protein
MRRQQFAWRPWLNQRGAGRRSAKGMKSGMAKAIIMAVKDVHLALVQRASSAKEDGQSQASSRASGVPEDGCSCVQSAPSPRTAGVAAGVLRSDVRSQ